MQAHRIGIRHKLVNLTTISSKKITVAVSRHVWKSSAHLNETKSLINLLQCDEFQKGLKLSTSVFMKTVVDKYKKMPLMEVRTFYM